MDEPVPPSAGRPATPAEEGYIAALEALERESADVSISAVAKRAGRSRTPIAVADCRFPGVRAKILASMEAQAAKRAESAPAPEEVDRKPERIGLLTRRLRASDSANALLLSQKLDAEARANRAERRMREAIDQLKRATAAVNGAADVP